MMEHRLDTHLKQLDEQAIADGEAGELLYCWYCSGYYSREKMGDVMCAECENGSGPEVVAHMQFFDKVLAEVHAKGFRRVKGIGQLVQMTLKEGMK